MKKAYEYIFFDLDGTLIDHFEAIHDAYRFAQERLNLPVASFEKVKATVGGSVLVTMRRLIGPDVSDEVYQEAITLFDQHFAEIMFEKVMVLPGVRELLLNLSGRGLPLAVFTNKKGDHARSVLEHLELAKFFQFIVGAGDTDYRKPQPEFTDYVLSITGASSESSLMVGDSPFDLEAGQVRGMDVALVATGSHDAGELRSAGADRVFEDMGRLGEAIFGGIGKTG